MARNQNVNTFIDVDANISIYSLYATSVNKEVKVFAIEPIAETFEELVKNIHLNDYSRQIGPEPVEFSFASGEGRMIVGGGKISK